MIQPNDFKDERYTLRQVLYEPARRTELFIVMTMYNEDDQLFTRTMHGVMSCVPGCPPPSPFFLFGILMPLRSQF